MSSYAMTRLVRCTASNVCSTSTRTLCPPPTKRSPVSLRQQTRAEGGKAGISASFISAGVHTQTTLTFNISPRQMLLKIAEELQERYALFDPATYANYEGTRLAGSKADSPLGNGGPKKRT